VVGKWDTDKLGKDRLVPPRKFKKVVKVFGVSFLPFYSSLHHEDLIGTERPITKQEFS